MRAFLVPFIPDDAAVHADDELRAFWASFEVQFDTPWRLPPLGFSSLVTLVTAELLLKPLWPLMTSDGLVTLVTAELLLKPLMVT